MEKITDAVMSEKPRYAILDGLRGVAAVIVSHSIFSAVTD